MARTAHESAALRRRSAIELAVVVGAAAATWALASVLELHESLVAFFARHESWQADELAIALGVLALGLAVHALRRRRDAEQALASEQRALADAARLAERNAELARGLIALQEDERAAIARELHDEMGQACTALRMDTALLKRAVALGDAEAARAAASRADQQAQSLLRGVRGLLQRLRPAHLEMLGLAAALEELCAGWQARSGVACSFHGAAEAAGGLGAEAELVVYRVAQEALTNVMRHARAGRVQVLLAREGESLALLVEDDGIGLPPEGERRGLGLLGAAERAAALGGTLALEGAAGSGTRVRLTLPLQPQRQQQALETTP
ncbi:ATP-binding protein [Rubrivivax gelatinosus]|uniref:Oxygen sensor histidine kinase NreB n=1 Tax=Rubrivivax gelatinosus TaxID=28068 RepID=A0ABS1DTP0_RUBGE|nr:ATP-binding protein [Rubrivivax gelatinosus]MBK1713397.1 hypothetical protein [Rubrivivax gelatinosus]